MEPDAGVSGAGARGGEGTGLSAPQDVDLSSVYRDYVACLNAQDWRTLGRYVHEEVSHNGRLIGLSGYRDMLERDFLQIPDLRFEIELLICDPPRLASRLQFDCTPKGEFLGLEVNGRRVTFAENVFYAFDHRKIKTVWSVIDRAAIEACLAAGLSR